MNYVDANHATSIVNYVIPSCGNVMTDKTYASDYCPECEYLLDEQGECWHCDGNIDVSGLMDVSDNYS